MEEGISSLKIQRPILEEGIDLSDPNNIILTISGSFSDIDRDGDSDFFKAIGPLGKSIF